MTARDYDDRRAGGGRGRFALRLTTLTFLRAVNIVPRCSVHVASARKKGAFEGFGAPFEAKQKKRAAPVGAPARPGGERTK